MKTKEGEVLKKRFLEALPYMKLCDVRDMVAYAEASARENPRSQTVLLLVRAGGIDALTGS
jgi:hypothetical protein